MFHVIERYFDEVAVRGERQANMLSLTYPPQDRGCAFAHVISQNVQQLLQGHRRGTCIPFPRWKTGQTCSHLARSKATRSEERCMLQRVRESLTSSFLIQGCST